VSTAAAVLHGRAAEERRVDDVVAAAAEGDGGALLLHGPAGIGKTALLERGVAAADERGMRVLRTSGLRAESALAFAGLHHLLLPVLGAPRDEASTPTHATLRTAFGVGGGTLPDLYGVALATLDLLSEVAGRRPVLLVVDDAHWTDPPTADVLAFVARRLAAEPMAMLVAVREGEPSSLGTALPVQELRSLDDRAAAAVLDDHSGTLSPAVRRRVLQDAAGNPLALVELPRAIARAGGLSRGAPELLTPDPLPLNARLERAFAARVDDLPEQARGLMLLAAADPACDLGQLLEAARTSAGAPVTPTALVPAVEAGLVSVVGRGVRFRHPLVASGIYHGASFLERVAAHGALAGTSTIDDDRRTWHRAAATLGTDEEVVDALVASAARAHRRGAVMASVAATERAASLTADARRRNDLLLRAAEQASELGRRDAAAAMLRRARLGDLGSVARARALVVLEMVDPGELADESRIAELHRAATTVADDDPDLAVRLLWRAASRAWWSGAGDGVRRPIVTATEALGLPHTDPRRLAILAYAAPIDQGGAVLAALGRLAPAPDDEPALRFAGSAALILGDFAAASRWWAGSETIYRAQSRLALLARNLSAGGYARCWTGEWDAVLTGEREACVLGADTGESFWATAGLAALAQLHGLRGDHRAAEAAARAALENPVSRGVRFVLFTAQQGLAYAAMADERDEEAYGLIRQCFDERSPVFHRDMRHWVLGDLAEFAVRAGAAHEARSLVADLAPAARRTTSPRTRVALAYAEALLAPPEHAEQRFRAALDLDLAPWPVDRARILLAYGTWLRRARRYSDSRGPLREAQAGLEALGPTAWSARAQKELAASGEVRRTRAQSVRDELTPQELQIATMAARGLTNRRIAQHLFLSPRTVSSHLYRAFPKLGITARGDLAAALEAGSAAAADGGASPD
jgi:DNA-binding CsgD family transcriptional regulator